MLSRVLLALVYTVTAAAAAVASEAARPGELQFELGQACRKANG